MIDVSDIHLIKVIVQVGSINRAAEVLHVSQPTLSKKISRLEQKINLELFNRHNAGMVPTEAALFLMAQSEGLENRLRVIERQLELMANLVGGQVKIGVGPIIEQVILPKVLLDFAEKQYEFRISVVTESAEALLEQLAQGHIDLAIGPFQPQEVSEEFSAQLTLSEELVLVARPGHEALGLRGQTISPELAGKFRFVSPSVPNHMGSRIRELVERLGLSPDITCDNYSLAKTIVANSDYFTAGPESLFRSELANGELVKLDFPVDLHWHCCCLVKPETLLMPRVKEVVALFGQYMEPMEPPAQ